MDKETILSQFDQIEKKIEDFINVRKRLETENIELKEKNNHLNNLLQEKIESENQNEELKTVIRTKIDSLIGRLEGSTE